MAASKSNDPDGDFAWGHTNAEGIALGVAFERVTSSGCEYRIAIGNRSNEPRAVVLFATLDNTFRTRIVARQGDNVVARPAVRPPVLTTSNVRLVVEVAPREVLVRAGAPASFGLEGAASLHVVLGGVPGQPVELTSGEVDVSLDPVVS